jgi:hypothetical protein
MKNILRNALIGLVILGASMASAAVPPMSVMVADSSGKLAYRGALESNGTFATGTLKAGHYVVQFNAKRNDIGGNNYALVVAAGRKKVVADAVAGEKFAGGGVAMRIEVAGGGNIVGQVAADLQSMTKDGRLLVWIPRQVDSNLPGHWAEADSAEARVAQTRPSYSIKNIQDKQNQGVGSR